MNYKQFNDPAFTDSIIYNGDRDNAGRNPLTVYTVKKRFHQRAPKGFGWWGTGADDTQLDVSWFAVPNWKEVTHDDPPEKHFGDLCIVARVPTTNLHEWWCWNIEHLRRPGENTGTSSVNTNGWAGAKTWMDVVAMKRTSPDKNWRPKGGDPFGLLIVGYPGGSRVRSDILPGVFPAGSVTPTPNPPTPPTGMTDAEFRATFRALVKGA